MIGQIAGIGSGGYAGAQVLVDIIVMFTGRTFSSVEFMILYAVVLIVAGIINSYAETLLTNLCYFSVLWHFFGTLVIICWMLLVTSKLQPISFALFEYENESGFTSVTYVSLIGALAAVSAFTGYDTAAHVAEETTHSHHSTPIAMLLAVGNCLLLGMALIVGMNVCVQDIDSLIDPNSTVNAYTALWIQTVGAKPTILFLFITFIAIECSNCANLTSASRMIYAFSRDDAIPLSRYWYYLNKNLGSPTRAIWLAVFIAFLLGLPGLVNDAVLNALFSLTATGLYSSYFIPLFLRITIAWKSFYSPDFNLGYFSYPLAMFSTCWCGIMTIVLCLPEELPVTFSNMNYSSIALGGVLIFSWSWWVISARYWFKGPKFNALLCEESFNNNNNSNGQIENTNITELCKIHQNHKHHQNEYQKDNNNIPIDEIISQVYVTATTQLNNNMDSKNLGYGSIS